MTNLREDDDTSTGRITQGGRATRTLGGTVWWLIGLVAVLIALALWWASSSQKVAPAEQSTRAVTGVGGGASSRVQTPAAGGVTPATATGGSASGAAGANSAGAGGATPPASANGTPSASHP